MLIVAIKMTPRFNEGCSKQLNTKSRNKLYKYKEKIQYLKILPAYGYIRDFIKYYLYRLLKSVFSIDLSALKPTKDMIIIFGGIRGILRPDTEDLLYYSGAAKLAFTEKWFKPKRGENVIDVGSNVGRYSLIAAKKGANVIAIEANPFTFKVLQKNCMINGFHNVKAFNVACSNKTGTIDELYYIEGYEGISSLDLNRLKMLAEKNIEPQKIPVKAEKLDNINYFSEIDWLLIDVEGHEVEVLEGAFETLKRTKRIIIEVDDDHKNLVCEILQAFNFAVVEEVIETPNVDRYLYLVKK